MATNNASKASNETSKSNPVVILIAWLWVGIPLCWGISQTLIKAAALFQ